jgi:tetratricopeptide (TPR) repeat protein
LVRDQAHQPIAQARVTLRWSEDPQAGPAPVATDKKGRWAYLGLATGNWSVRTEAPGYVAAEQVVAVYEGEAATTVETTLSPDPFAAVDEGNALLDAREYAAARAKYQSVLEDLEGEQQAALRSRIADAYFEEGNFAAARGDYEKALAGLPEEKQPHVLLRLGAIHLEAGEYAAARERFERVSSLLPVADRPQVVLQIAQTHDREGHPDLAIETLEQARSLAPENLDILQLLADLLMREGREEEAQAYLAQLPKDAELPADLVLNLGIRHYNQGDLDEAFVHFDRAATQNPDLPDVYYYRGLVYLARGDNAKAAADLQKFLELAPDSPRAAEARSFLEHLQSRQ